MATVATGSTPLPEALPVHFTEAIEFQRNKLRLPTRVWTDMWQDMHSRAYVVAGAMKDALVKDFHEAVTRAIADGLTLEDFRKDFDRIVKTHGWSYKGSRGWRSRTIYETNLSTAFSAGRWAQIQRLKSVRPYIRYITMADENVRFSHRKLHDIVLPVDHPFWQSYFPPNDWGCRCFVQSLSEADLKRLGLKVTPDSSLPKGVQKTTIRTPEGDKEIETPEGIAPGWNYNPGAGAFGRGPNALAIARHGDRFDALEGKSSMRATAGPLEPQPPRAGVGPDPAVRPDGTPYERALQRAFRNAFGGDEAIYSDPLGNRVSITQAVTDHLLANPKPANVNRSKYWPLVRELIEEPQEIWVGFSRHEPSGRVYLRRRYVKLFDLGTDEEGKARVIALVADEEAGQWQAVTVFAGRPRDQLNTLRSGIRAYG
ncbi:MAG: minor capsid protein [Alphaproteobacteria bacterium]|nr:minor capsid protein [Alphaproteobacteria bacterium]